MIGERIGNLNGFDLYESPIHQNPKLQLREGHPCSEGFAAEFNCWLADRFGYNICCAVPEGQMYIVGDRIYVRQGMGEVIRQQLRKELAK